MSTRALPVVAAIPAYNAERTLDILLPQVLEQEYDLVYLLDDRSTDHTLDVAYSFGRDVNVVHGEKNVGPGANRNRIIGKIGPSVIHFLDADVVLNSERSPERAREALENPKVGFTGGIVRNPDGSQNPYNFGPRMSLKSSFLVSGVQYGVYALGNKHPEPAKKLRKSLNRYLSEWPNTFDEPQARDIYWTAESNLVIRSVIFEALGGYNPKLRYHEIMEFSIRSHEAGLKSRFDPSIDVTHSEVDALNKKFNPEPIKAAASIILGMGFKNWISPPKEP
jgi:glycosyltransferase involved in cell wall biosynthesis